MSTFTGKVVSTGMARTVVVEREITVTHPLYKKKLKRTRRIKAHTDVSLKVGDVVTIKSSRPLARNVHFRVVADTAKSL